MATTSTNGYMFDIIASSFFQKKTCRLPGIGNLELVTTSAEYDFSQKQIRSPRQTILFVSTPASNAGFNEFSAISQLLNDELDKNGKVDITGLGTFTKDENGLLHFLAATVNEDFLQAVAAEKVIHKDAEHPILVGDKETTNTQMAEYFSDDVPQKKNRWWVWMLLIAVTSIVALGVYFVQYGFNDLSSRASF